MRHPSRGGIAGGLFLAVVMAACTGGPGGSPTPEGTDVFTGRTYRLDLPRDWIVLGDAAYDESIDATADVDGWLRDLELAGPNAFRAYEPEPAAAGLRLAINPPVAWNADADGPLTDAALLTTMPGVSEQPVGDWVAIGSAGKGGRFRWAQTLDWGAGTPSSRTCIGYQVLTEFDPVNVVFTYPVGTDRFDEVDALMTSFEVLGSPVSSVPPGATPTPSPTPYDKYGSPEPVPTYHADPALEALLPDSLDGVELRKDSRTGEQAGMTDTDPILRAFGKHPADLTTATAMPDRPPMLIVAVMRLRGVSGGDLLDALVADLPDDQVSNVTLAGRDVTSVVAGAWPVWYYPSGDDLYSVAAIDEATVASVMALLP